MTALKTFCKHFSKVGPNLLLGVRTPLAHPLPQVSALMLKYDITVGEKKKKKKTSLAPGKLAPNFFFLSIRTEFSHNLLLMTYKNIKNIEELLIVETYLTAKPCKGLCTQSSS